MRKHMRAGSRWGLAFIVGAAALVLAGCGDLPEGVDGDLTGDWPELPAAQTFTPQAGVCHTEPHRPEASIAHYDPLSCDQPHLVETVHVGAFTGEAGEEDNPPAMDSWQRRAAFSQCEDEVEEFLGADFRYGRLWLGVAVPTAEAWSSGARWFRCDVTELDAVAGEPVMRAGSLAGALADDADARLGCFRVEVDDEGIVAERVAVACDEPHRGEFVGTWRAPDGGYPDPEDDDAARDVNDGCRSRVAAYTDVPDDDQLIYRVGVIVDWMSERDWNAGDRAFRCYLWLDEDVSESYRDIGADALPVRTE